MQQFAMTYGALPGQGASTFRVRTPGEAADAVRPMSFLYADYGLHEVLGFELIAGRFFSEEFPSDSAEAFVLNEAAVRALGFEDAPLGRELEYLGGGTNDIEKRGRVVGVVKDFNFASLHSPVEPLVMTLPIRGLWQWPGVELVARLAPGNVPETLQRLEAQWKVLVPDWPFRAAFLDATLDQQFAVAAPVGYVLMESWLASFAYRIDLGLGVFLVSGTAVLVVALITVSYQSLKAARSNPIDALRYE